jgi:hypothetical protein
MEIYFVLDFYCQTVAGLKRDIKESGVDNIDSWEDMEEDANLIEVHLLSQIALEPLEHYCFQDKTNYVLRYLCCSKQEIVPFLNANKEIILNLITTGWAPFSTGGIPFKIAQLNNKASWSELESKKFVSCDQLKGEIYSFRK